jgi:hypothetical protein
VENTPNATPKWEFENCAFGQSQYQLARVSAANTCGAKGAIFHEYLPKKASRTGHGDGAASKAISRCLRTHE